MQLHTAMAQITHH